MYLSIGKASLILGVSISTLRAWERDGKIAPSFQTKGGHRRYSIVNLKEQFGLNNKNEDRVTLAYARVSSSDQRDDLERQKERLDRHCRNEKAPYILIDDLGSGLKKLINMILSGKVKKIVLTHKDRLLRFGAEIIFYLCTFFNTDIELIEEEKELSDNERLAFDVVEIITVFSARLYGKRAHRNKKLLHEGIK